MKVIVKQLNFLLWVSKKEYQIEAVFRRLTDKIKDQQDLLNKRECDFQRRSYQTKSSTQRKETR